MVGTPSQTSSGMTTRLLTEISIFAVWRVSRSSETSLIAAWTSFSPDMVVASIRSGPTGSTPRIFVWERTRPVSIHSLSIFKPRS